MTGSLLYERSLARARFITREPRLYASTCLSFSLSLFLCLSVSVYLSLPLPFLFDFFSRFTRGRYRPRLSLSRCIIAFITPTPRNCSVPVVLARFILLARSGAIFRRLIAVSTLPRTRFLSAFERRSSSGPSRRAAARRQSRGKIVRAGPR